MTHNSNIIGHEKHLKYLERCVRSGMRSHAYIFSGPSKVGKRALAVEFVRRQYCEDKNDEKGECRNCKTVMSDTHPNFFVIDPEHSDRKEIGIEEIRDLRTKLTLTPYGSASFTSILINNAERLTYEAVSALLKTLEEPRPNTYFILITDNLEAIPETIRSRAYILPFFPVSQDVIERYLIEARGCNTRDARIFARCSFGRPGLAIDMARLGETHPLIRYSKILNSVIEGGTEERLIEIEGLVGEGEHPFDFLDSLSIFIRDEMMVRLSCSDLTVGRGLYGLPETIMPRYTKTKLSELLQRIERVKRACMTTNINFRLALEALILEF